MIRRPLFTAVTRALLNQTQGGIGIRFASTPSSNQFEIIDHVKNTQAMMDANFKHFQDELSMLRSGRASTGVLESISVEAYGSRMSLSSLATVTVRNANLLHVNVHDAILCENVKRAIDNAGLGFNASITGNGISVPVAKTSKETRETLVKTASVKAEKARVDLRRSRKLAMDKLDKVEESMGKDEKYRLEKKIQTLTDSYMDKVVQLHARKTDELRHG